MLISMNWIRDFVDLSGQNIEELIKRFTLSTAEVEEVFYKGRDIQNVVVGKVVEFSDHPKSKKLHLLKVDAGDKIYDCVCGAPNARLGLTVAFAKIGGRAGGIDIKECEIAGCISQGMCCSEAELFISAEHEGIMELDDSLTAGTDIKEIFDIDDIVFEVDNKSLTNRPDLWGHFGIAREFAALAGKELKPVSRVNASIYVNLPDVSIDVKNDMCYRYCGVKIENISIKKSPVNMKIRLFYTGSRSINLLADITNYCMLELGQPMHAFDLKKVDKIEVQMYKEPFSFKTLDENERAIDENTLMISCDSKPVAVAGIMGGLDSEITDGTDSILLESACFDSVCVRKTSMRLSLRTDASQRYEKSLDPENAFISAERYIKILLDIDKNAKVISNITDVYTKKFDTIKIEFDKHYVNRYTGIEINNYKIKETLISLGFEIVVDGENFSVTVPSWRATKDVSIKADIIEEITRIYGYDNFCLKSAECVLSPVRSSVERDASFQIKTVLSKRYNMHEVHSYLWCDANKYKHLSIDMPDNVKLINSISPENVILRRLLTPSLLSFVYENKQWGNDFGIFEIGKAVEGLDKDNSCVEKKKLCVILYSRTKDEQLLLSEAVNAINSLSVYTKNANLKFEKTDKLEYNWMHPANTADIITGSEKIGFICTLHPVTNEKIDKKAAIVCAELDFSQLAATENVQRKFKTPSKFPGIFIDLTFVVPSDMSYGEIYNIATQNQNEYLQSCELVGIYEDEANPHEKSVSIRLDYVSYDKTLSVDEVNEYAADITNAFAQKNIFIKQ